MPSLRCHIGTYPETWYIVPVRKSTVIKVDVTFAVQQSNAVAMLRAGVLFLFGTLILTLPGATNHNTTQFPNVMDVLIER